MLLAGYRWRSCLVYLDDVIIFSKTMAEHLRDVQEILSVLHTGGLSLKLRKCHFFQDCVNYLGHVVRPGQLEVAMKKIDCLRYAKHPTTQTQLRSFLGLCNVYRRFVPNYAAVAHPLNQLLTKGNPSKLPSLNEEQTKAFAMLRDALISPPVLALPRPALPFTVDTDASDYQIGCALMQEHEDGIRYPIGFWSRSLAPAERNYSASEKECLAVVWAVQILRPYLERKHFILYTDHQALRWLMELADAASRLARWRLRLMEFDFTVKYKQGIKNNIADAISRLPTFGFTRVAPDLDIPCLVLGEGVGVPDPVQLPGNNNDIDLKKSVLAMEAGQAQPVQEPVDVNPISLEDLRQAQDTDPYCKQIRADIETSDAPRFDDNDVGVLVRVSPIDGSRAYVVPERLRQKILLLAHHSRLGGHPGINKMYYTLRQSFYWPNMMADIRRCCQECHSCVQERLALRKHASALKLFPASRPLESVAIDILGPLVKSARGHRFLLVIACRFSKFTRVVPLVRTTALAVAKAFVKNWVFAYGAPATLLSDNGPQFAAKFFQQVCKTLGTVNKFTTTYHPQANGQVERFNRTVLAGLRAFVAEHPQRWHEFAPSLAFAYNTQVNPATGERPFDLVVSHPPNSVVMRIEEDPEAPLSHRDAKLRFISSVRRLCASASKRLESFQSRYKADFDKHVRPSNQAVVGDLVYLSREQEGEADKVGNKHRHKLLSKGVGPFPVIKTATHTVVVNRDGVLETVSRDRIAVAPAPKPGDLPVPVELPSGAVPDPSEEWAVKRVMAFDPASETFRVRWEGYSADADTWEPPSSLPWNMARRFFRRKKMTPPPGVLAKCH